MRPAVFRLHSRFHYSGWACCERVPTRRIVESLASGAKVENGILLRRDGRAIASGGLKAPVLQCEQKFLIEFWTEALKHGLGDNISPLIDNDLNWKSAVVAHS